MKRLVLQARPAGIFILLLSALFLLWSSTLIGAFFTDPGNYPEPVTPPALPAAGGTFVDPTFNTRELRVTDENDGKYCFNHYSYWPVFNADNTRLYYECRPDPGTVITMIAVFDPVNFKIVSKNQVPIYPTCPRDAVVWSHSDPKVIYCAVTSKFLKLTLNSQGTAFAAETLMDIAPAHPGLNIWQTHTDDHDTRMSFHTIISFTNSSTAVGAGVFNLQTKQLDYYTEDPSIINPGFDETQISGDGQWDFVKAIPATVIKLADGSQTSTSNTGHSDNSGDRIYFLFGGSACHGGSHLCIASKSFADFNTTAPSLLIDFGGWPGGPWGISALGTLRTHRINGNFCCWHPQTKNWENDLFSFPMDGSAYPNAAGQVHRYAHTYSYPASTGGMSYYAYSIHAASSYDGRFIAYPSTWGPRDRIDLFIVDTGEAGSNPPPTATQTPPPQAGPLGVKVFPNPWRKDQPSGGITFTSLPANSTVKIFTASGSLVRAQRAAGSEWVWDLKNDQGAAVARGVYLYVITDGQGNKQRGKVAILR